VKYLASLMIVLAAANCGGGKKKAAMWWMALLGNQTAQTAETTSSAGDSVTTTNNDQTGTTGFSFQTTTTVPVSVTVADSNGPVQGAVVQVQDPSAANTVIFQAVTNETGQASGTFTVDNTVTEVTLVVDAGGNVVTQPVNTTNLVTCDRDVDYPGDVTISSGGDQDGDGITDANDAYPSDPTRATKVTIPGSGQSIIAYEDLYPSPGDADFNDYVVKVSNEEDLNAAGKVVRLRGSYTHIARGAGYTHQLKLTLPAAAGALNYTVKQYSAAGALESTTTNHYSNGSGLAILGNSNNTITQSNTSSGQTFTPGKRADIEITFDTPVSQSTLGSAPFDLYIHVNNTGLDVHFPRMYFDANGKDQYMDTNGFPWALQIPEAWKWPLESDNIENGYPGFRPWYLSSGTTNKDWYSSAVSSHVFNASSLFAYLKSPASWMILGLIAAIAVIGLALAMIQRRRAA
jgi:LruC domain-containing protein